MYFRKPELIPTLFCTAALVVLVGLGNWQMGRLHWKEQVMAETTQKQQEPILASLPEDVQGLTYRKAALTGRFMYDKAIHLIGRQQGMDVGYYMVTPLVLDDDGRIVLVDRGFSPLGKESKPQGLVTVEGIFRPLRPKRYFAPTNRPDKNIWSYEDIGQIADYIGKEPLPLALEATGTPQKDVFPIPNEGKIIFLNNHLGYAVTWYGLALVSLVMFGAYYRKKIP